MVHIRAETISSCIGKEYWFSCDLSYLILLFLSCTYYLSCIFRDNVRNCEIFWEDICREICFGKLNVIDHNLTCANIISCSGRV
jgi:hypothetical protein